jgi:paraquat-inducible protein A
VSPQFSDRTCETSPGPQRLFDQHRGRWDIPTLALLALVLLAFGVRVPALTFENLFADDTFSVLTGIQAFFESGNLLLGLLLLSFSVLFPAAKMLTIGVLWFARIDGRRRAELVRWLELLGKWSLLDAFVIAVLVGTVQLGILTQARAEPGIWLYLAAIVLSLIGTFLLQPLVRTREKAEHHLPTTGLWLTIPCAVLYGAGLSLPLIEVEKCWFWENKFSLLDGTTQLFARGELPLAIALVVFVLIVPTARFVGLVALRLLRGTDSRAIVLLRAIDKWSMVDVFVLAIFVVVSKLGAIATVEPRVGMWLLFAAAVLSVADSVLLQRARRA